MEQLKIKISLKDKLSKLLSISYPDYEFNEAWIYRDYSSNSKNGFLCRWWAEGRKYSSYIRYTEIIIYGHDTMKDCVKYGIVINSKEKPLNVICADI